ncbi:hypothetical protein RM572_27935 [Streptomyces sp. DSM 42041]|uniref:Phage or prophage related protein n=1 Tax=Streptomyces hazeniae TaxID=3075538 RepID=A0ABU2P015_9ACTN|nr:hypothetical protein [Streptomyces sp. DSM 42041]MDT0382589.1 hypothetical protein [Streptomyces sp. DSM 42041]
MARIRTIKPEAFESEDLASVSVTAERTFFGLLTLADDTGRFRDHPAIICGRLWALRSEHTSAHVAHDLEQLAAAGLICRYTGCDGRRYLHIVTWARHQKIDRPSASRIPRCPGHQGDHKCSGCGEAQCREAGEQGVLIESSTNPQRALVQPETPPPPPAARLSQSETTVVQQARPRESGRTRSSIILTGQSALDEGSSSTREDAASGSRILDPGSFLTGREAPAPNTPPEAVSAKDLLAEYIQGCAHRPPQDLLGLLGRKVKALLGEGFAPETIRAALERLRVKALHPSVLPSLVNEVLNAPVPQGTTTTSASGAGPWAPSTSAYRPYIDPAAPEPTTFGGR